jgi:hypothetical protein
MTEQKEYGIWRLCAWNGPLFMGVFIYFWGWLGHNFPPFQPDVAPEVVAGYFRDHANAVRTGMVVAMTFCVSYCVWGLAIGKVLERIVGRQSILTELQRWGAGLTVVPLLVSSSFWLTGSFRPEVQSDTTLQMLYDMAWLLIDLGYSVTSVQMFAMGAAFLRDQRAVPLVPKWLAWYGIWVGFMFVAECIMPFFRNGAFARSGILNFWIEFMIWVVWVPVLTIYIFKAINRIEQEDAGRA